MTEDDARDTFVVEEWMRPLHRADAARLRVLGEARIAFAEAGVEAEREWQRVAGEHFGWKPSDD